METHRMSLVTLLSATMLPCTRSHHIELSRFDRSSLCDRVRLLLEMLNMTLLLPRLASMCPESCRDDCRVEHRSNQGEMILCPTSMIKCFSCSKEEETRAHLEAIYLTLRKYNVPNVERLDGEARYWNKLVFAPRGTDTRPSSITELFCALRSVLEALVKLHAAKWMHRDIQWSKVLRRRDDSDSWFLVDFSKASRSPGSSMEGLSRQDHAPQMFDSDPHTKAVDIWGVGYFIQRSEPEVYDSWCTNGQSRVDFMELLMNPCPSRRPTAAVALRTLKHLETQHHSSHKRRSNAVRPCDAKKGRTKRDTVDVHVQTESAF